MCPLGVIEMCREPRFVSLALAKFRGNFGRISENVSLDFGKARSDDGIFSWTCTTRFLGLRGITLRLGPSSELL